jgi:hypothetical protein
VTVVQKSMEQIAADSKLVVDLQQSRNKSEASGALTPGTVHVGAQNE